MLQHKTDFILGKYDLNMQWHICCLHFPQMLQPPIGKWHMCSPSIRPSPYPLTMHTHAHATSHLFLVFCTPYPFVFFPLKRPSLSYAASTYAILKPRNARCRRGRAGRKRGRKVDRTRKAKGEEREREQGERLSFMAFTSHKGGFVWVNECVLAFL